jgi:hypothetical protein
MASTNVHWYIFPQHVRTHLVHQQLIFATEQGEDYIKCALLKRNPQTLFVAHQCRKASHQIYFLALQQDGSGELRGALYLIA